MEKLHGEAPNRWHASTADKEVGGNQAGFDNVVDD